MFIDIERVIFFFIDKKNVAGWLCSWMGD